MEALTQERSTWVAFWRRLVCHEFAVSGSHVHTNDGTQAVGLNGVSGNFHCFGALGFTSSDDWATSSSFTSSNTWATLPASLGELLGSQPLAVKFTIVCWPPRGAPG